MKGSKKYVALKEVQKGDVVTTQDVMEKVMPRITAEQMLNIPENMMLSEFIRDVISYPTVVLRGLSCDENGLYTLHFTNTASNAWMEVKAVETTQDAMKIIRMCLKHPRHKFAWKSIDKGHYGEALILLGARLE